jgi:lactoylglutathione lyase
MWNGEILSDDKISKMLGIRTVIYEVDNLGKAIDWYSKAFAIEPYVNTPEYVGFNIRGYELGLMPEHEASQKGNNVLSYWGVDNVDKEYAHLIDIGAKPNTPITAVGGDIRLGTLIDPFGNVIGLIYNPIFKIDE